MRNAKNSLLKIFMFFLCLASSAIAAAPQDLREFLPGSYAQILAQQAHKPFALIIWSITCPSCIKDMQLLSELHKKTPDFKMIMLAADDLSAREQIQSILTKHGLNTLENWVYADDNTQKLNYEIDAQWYGELPRTYFFDAQQQRTGISGVIKKADFEAMLTKVQNAH